MAELGVFVPYEALFPNEPTSFDHFRGLVTPLSRATALVVVAKINHDLCHRGEGERHGVQEGLASRFLGAATVDRLNAWAREHNFQRGAVAIFFRQQLLALASWIAVLAREDPDGADPTADVAARERFVRAALLAGDGWGRRFFPDDLPAFNEGDAARRAATEAFRAATESTLPLLRRELVRSAALYDARFVEDLPEAEHVLVGATGCDLALYRAYSLKLSEAPRPILDVDGSMEPLAPQARARFEEYIGSVSQTPTELAGRLRADVTHLDGWEARFDHLPIREKPLIHIGEGQTIVLDPIFLRDKLTVGPLFALANRLPKKRSNTVFGAFGNAVERYANEMFAAMLPDGEGLVSRVLASPKIRRASGKTFEACDTACILDPHAVALVETKGVFLPEPGKGTAPDSFLHALKRKYAHEPDPKQRGDRRRGVTQLAHAIRALAHDGGSLEGIASEAATIYPILVAYDDLLGAPGHLEFFREAFVEALGVEEALAPRGVTFMVGALRVRPLVVATITDLEFVECSLRAFSLKDILDDYLASLRHESFHDHLARHKTRLGLRENTRLDTRAAELSREIGLLLSTMAGSPP